MNSGEVTLNLCEMNAFEFNGEFYVAEYGSTKCLRQESLTTEHLRNVRHTVRCLFHDGGLFHPQCIRRFLHHLFPKVSLQWPANNQL